MPAVRTAAPVSAPPAILCRAASGAENPSTLLRDSVASLIAMDRDRLQLLAARALRAERQRGWQRMNRREQATFLAERQLLEALLAETRRNLRLFRALSSTPQPPQRLLPDGTTYEATGALWAD